MDCNLDSNPSRLGTVRSYWAVFPVLPSICAIGVALPLPRF